MFTQRDLNRGTRVNSSLGLSGGGVQFRCRVGAFRSRLSREHVLQRLNARSQDRLFLWVELSARGGIEIADEAPRPSGVDDGSDGYGGSKERTKMPVPDCWVFSKCLLRM